MPEWDFGKPLPGLTKDHFLSQVFLFFPFLSFPILSRHGRLMIKLPGLTKDHFLSQLYPVDRTAPVEGPYKIGL